MTNHEPKHPPADMVGLAELVEQLRDEDSYYRVQEKHWCIDAEELERQRLAAANLIEAQAREIERLLASVKGWAADAARLNDNADYWRQECHRLREALAAYTEYCGICHGRGSFIEEDAVTGADLWRDCPGCTPARAALGEKK